MCAPKKKADDTCSTVTAVPTGASALTSASALRYFSMSASIFFWTSSFQTFQYASAIAERSILTSAVAESASAAHAARITVRFMLRPPPVIGPFLVPFLRRRPRRRKILARLALDKLLVELVDAEIGLRRHLDESALVGERGLHEVAPPRDVHAVELERHEVAGRRRDVHRREARNRGLRHVQVHLHAVVLGHVADLLGLEAAAAGQKVGMDHRERVRLEERLEILLEVDVLAGAERSRGRGMELAPLLDVAPRQDVLRPGEMVLLEAPEEIHAVLVGDVSEMVDRERDLPADLRADVRHVLLEIVEAGFGDVDAGEAVRGVEEVVRLAAHDARIDRAVGRLHDVLHLPLVVEEAERRDERVLDVHQKLDAEVHLEEGEAHLHAFDERLAHVASAALGVRVAVAADAVAPFSAEKLPHGKPPRLAAEVPARELDRADAAGLARVAAELLDAAEDLLDVAGVLAENAGLQHRRVGAGARVPDLAVADEALVGVELQERAAFRRAVDVRKAHVGDLQRRGIDLVDVHVRHYSPIRPRPQDSFQQKNITLSAIDVV